MPTLVHCAWRHPEASSCTLHTWNSRIAVGRFHFQDTSLCTHTLLCLWINAQVNVYLCVQICAPMRRNYTSGRKLINVLGAVTLDAMRVTKNWATSGKFSQTIALPLHLTPHTFNVFQKDQICFVPCATCFAKLLRCSYDIKEVG